MMEKQTLSEPTTAHRLHCIGCGAEIAGAEAAEDFRCRECGNLFEVDYPELLPRGADSGLATENLAGSWKELWQERPAVARAAGSQWGMAVSRAAADYGGRAHVVTLEEGNTPLYHLPRCGKSLGVELLFAKHQGMNPTGSLQGYGDDGGAVGGA